MRELFASKLYDASEDRDDDDEGEEEEECNKDVDDANHNNYMSENYTT